MSFKFQHSEYLNRHECMHNDTKEFVCQHYDKQFNSSKTLNQHNIRLHTEVKPYKCKTCDKAFIYKYLLHKHERTHSNEHIECKKCANGFNSKQDLYNHLETKHIVEKPYKCETCLITFRRLSSLKQHTKIHKVEKSYLCKVCCKAFLYKYQLDRHSFVHSDKKPHECSTCGISYRQRKSLLAHVQKEGHVGIVEN